MKKIVILPLMLAAILSAQSNTQKAGDILTAVIPALAYGMTFVEDDPEGRMAFYKSYGSTMATAVALKHTVREKRPDRDEYDSFPSGHTSSAFSGASFVHRRYGFGYALPFYLGAVYTAYSRVHVNRHHPRDVIVGALIGTAWSWYFVDPKEKLSVTPEVDSQYKGVQVQYRF